MFIDQLAALTGGCQIRVTPAIHVGGEDISVDAYEVPHRIKEQVILRDPFDVFPWSSIESGCLDLNHTEPFRAGGTAQTRAGNLEPLSRRAHRVKTHAGWDLEQPEPGGYIWTTGAGQRVRVDSTGSYFISDLE